MRKSVKIIKYLILGGIFLIPFLVLVVPESLFFPFITGKNFIFRILIEIIFGLWLTLAIFDENYRPKFAGRPACAGRRTWILIIFAGFVSVLVLSTIFGANPYRSFWSNYERMEGLISYLYLFAYFFVIAAVIKTEKLWKWFFHASLAANAIVCVYGLLQLAGKLAIHQSSVRLDATLGNASYLAIYMVFHIFLALMLFFREREWFRWLYIPLIFLQTAILYHTATRGAILGFVGGMLLFAALIALFSKDRKVRIASLGSLILVVFLLAGFLAARNSSFVKGSPVLSRFSSISMEEQTTQSRFVVWKMSWEGFKEKPILGWGPENYNLVFNKYYEPILWKQEPWFDRAHNVFMDRLAQNGILGLVAYLGLFASALYYLHLGRRKNIFSVYDSAILTSMFAAYFFHNLFVFDNLVSSILFFTFLGYIHSRIVVESSINGSSQDEPLIARGDDYRKYSFALIIFIFTVFIIYFLNVPGILASRDILRAFEFTSKGDAQSAFQEFQSAIARDSFGSGEAREHLSSFTMSIVQQQNLDNEFKSKVFEFTVSEMKKQAEQSPGDIRYLIFLGALYNKAGRYDNAIDTLQKAIEISPKKQQLYFELGSSYLNKQEYEKALEILKTAFELEPDFFEARKIYAVAAIFAGKNDLAKEIMKDYGGFVAADERFARAFSERKEFAQAAAVWKKLIEANPGNLQYRLALSSSYLQSGQRQEAIDQLQKIIELEPKFKQQGEYYINEIKAGRNP
ncbi:tetratricopeptide repeat protein [Patescibacteria group bacterium]|nr:tetratricopeptide repeat protein [Patescibacteria group bacterium]MBU4353446.1 tetratricopeptide repeat protein [Patescibacteria group bacterium]